MVWKFVCLQNSYAEILPPKVMVLRCGAFGGWFGHEGGVPISGTHALLRAPQNYRPLSAT